MPDTHTLGTKVTKVMNTDKNHFLYSLFNIICSNNDIENISDDLKSGFSDFYDLSEINILYYDNNLKKLKNVTKNFEPAEDYFSKEKMAVLNEIAERLQQADFVINDEINTPTDIFDCGNVIAKSVSIPLKDDNLSIGLLRLKFKSKTELSENNLKTLKMLAYVLSLKVTNTLLNKQLEINSSFYKSMKGIAKIIETQYDFQYIIPLIGEMIDKFVMNHLIYIFIKTEEGKYTLFWPGACWNKKVYDLIDKLSADSNEIISEDKTTGVFPLISEGNLLGCIVAHSTMDKLTDEEIGYITELTKQSSVTIERANTYSEILRNSTLDALTGLNNRRQFEVRLSEQYAIANRQNTPLCAIMIDIDYFKKFNDTYGHAVGDIVLKTTANVIKEQLREYDIPSRYGGEEFCILLPHTNITEAQIVAERLRSAVKDTKIDIGKGQYISLTISVGLAELDIRDVAEDLYMKADSALYKAKEGGRNRVCIFSK